MNGTVSFKGTLLHNGSVQTQWPYRYINVLLYSRSHCLMRLRRGICVRFSRIFSFNRMHGKIWSFFSRIVAFENISKWKNDYRMSLHDAG